MFSNDEFQNLLETFDVEEDYNLFTNKEQIYDFQIIPKEKYINLNKLHYSPFLTKNVLQY